MSATVDDLKKQLGETSDPDRKISLLHSLVDELLRTDTGQSLVYATESLALAERIRDGRLQARSLYYLAMCKRALAAYSSTLPLLEQALKLLSHPLQEDEEFLAALYQERGINYARMNRYAEALNDLEQCYEIIERHQNEQKLPSVLNNMGIIYSDIGDYLRALDCYFRSLAFCEKHGSSMRMGVIFNNIGTIFHLQDEYQEALQYYKKSLEHRRKQGDTFGEGQTLGNISGVLLHNQEYSDALEHLLAALHIFESLGERMLQGQTQLNIGITYDHMKQPEAALACFYQAISLLEPLEEKMMYSSTLTQIGKVYRTMRLYHEALYALHQALAIAQKYGIKDALRDIHYELFLLHSGNSEPQKAYTHHKEFVRLRTELYNSDVRRQMAELQIRLEIEKARKEKELLAIRNQYLQAEIYNRNRELATLAMYIIQKNELLEKLRKYLLKISLQPGSRIERYVHTLLSEIRTHLGTQEHWQAFREQFERFNENYLAKLSEQYPALTPAELKVCALMKMNMSSKEMAQFLLVSERSVETHRRRIRQKLELATETNLYSFLAAI